MSIRTTLVVAAVVYANMGAAQAQEAGFGSTSSKVITGAFQFAVERDSQTNPAGADPEPTIGVALRPSFDFFVAPNVSLGGEVIIQYVSAGDLSVTGTGIGARGGYNAKLGPKLSLWPTLELAFMYVSIDSGVGGSASGNNFSVIAFAPLLIHLSPHFFLGGGPYFATELSATIEGEDTSKTTVIGIRSVVGGWF